MMRAFAVVGAVLAVLSIPAFAQDQDPIEEVVVTGIRASLDNAADIKENADGIVDAISAEELGKFPDINVAESLQRITGVAIARTRGGRGRFVTIRGLGEEFNAVTYNGRLLATENAGREFSFDNIASELISRAEVYKTSQAVLGDGSIGGRVNLVAAKPLDQDGFRTSFSAAGNYDTLSEDDGTSFSGIISNSFMDGTFGVLASVNYLRRDFRVDVAQSIDTFQLDVDDAGNGFAVGGAPAGTNLVAEAARYTSVAVGTVTEEFERLGGSLTLQWQPRDDLDLTFDALYTAFESPGVGTFQTNYPCPACGTTSNIVVADNNVITQFDSVISSEYLATEQQSDTDTIQLGFNASWQATETLDFEFDASWSNAEGIRDNFGSGSGSGSFYVIGVPNSLFQYNYTGGEVPNIDSLAPSFDPVTGQAVPPANVGVTDVDPRIFGAHFTRDTSNLVEDDVVTVALRGTLDFGDDTSLNFGIDYYDRNKTNQLFNNRNSWCNYFCGFAFSLRGLNPQLFDEAFSVPFPVDDFLDDAGASVPDNFTAFSPQAIRDLYASVVPGAPVLDANGNPTGAVHDFTGFTEVSTGADILRPRLRLDSSNDLTERVTGIYSQLNFNGTVGDYEWRANAGVRIAWTDLSSDGFINEIIDIQPAAGADQIFTFSDPVPRNLTNNYVDVLPSFNIQLYLDDNTILRAAFSETITRPTLTDLTTARTVTGTNVDVEAITSGNPELGPTRANNFDLSYEYYGEDITASVALFYKDIDGFIADAVTEEFIFDRTFQVTRPTNGDTAEVKGVELSWLHYLDNGFGYQANYTFADSEAIAASGNVTDLENVSDNTYNLSAFYEDRGFAIRLSYNYRDEFVRAAEGLQGFPEIVDEYGQLDFTASYDVNDYLTVFFEGANLTDEDEFVFSDQRNLLRYYEERGTRLSVGIRGYFQ